ncbi:MAG: hypothetical protein FWC91_02495 [Defluviitaleaceae bacterium]|nr:hypothetical protein [Defluviitaleaceae bacterium]
MIDKYTNLLESYPLYLSVAEELIAANPKCLDHNQLEPNQIIIATTAYMTSPVLLNYVFWVLEQAEAQGIGTLYFLSRDGYVLKIIGEKLASVWFPSIECKYFYCSRYALQTTSKSLLAEYMLQEGLHKPDIAIVDTGWMGSMQKNIQAIRSQFFGNDHIIGYYFGMLSKGFRDSGTYKTYLFSPGEKWIHNFGFNANVFECLCSADHGMTIDYKKTKTKIEPRFSENIPNGPTTLQLQIIKDYMEHFMARNPQKRDVPIERSIIRKLLWRFIHSPTKAEAATYGSILFAHDSKENQLYPLAEKTDVSLIKNNLFFFRLINKIWLKRKVRPLYWIEGTAVLSGYSLGMDMYLLYAIRLILQYYF